MQNAKDTFYEVMRGRLTTVNPERTIVLRGVTRPGVLVQENEVVTAVHLPDCFRMQWTVAAVEAGALPTVTLLCDFDYETAGTADNAGMDRGRLLSAMDAEVYAALTLTPQNAPKADYSALVNGQPAVAMATCIWWGDPVFGKTTVRGDRLGRVVTVAVVSYQEAGEL